MPMSVKTDASRIWVKIFLFHRGMFSSCGPGCSPSKLAFLKNLKGLNPNFLNLTINRENFSL